MSSLCCSRNSPANNSDCWAPNGFSVASLTLTVSLQDFVIMGWVISIKMVTLRTSKSLESPAALAA
jgi:hypothetical protein